MNGAHNLAVNVHGDLFISETYEGKRVQKFRHVHWNTVTRTEIGGRPLSIKPAKMSAGRTIQGVGREGRAGSAHDDDRVTIL